MSLPVITRHFEFDAGHRLLKHTGKCYNVHGHRWALDLSVSGLVLDKEQEMIEDFSYLKLIVGGWIDKHWDHSMIVQDNDPLLNFLVDNDLRRYVVPFAPTSEKLVMYVGQKCRSLLPALNISEVTLWETPNCKATWRP